MAEAFKPVRERLVFSTDMLLFSPSCRFRLQLLDEAA
jgi:hypothetical protein